MPDLKTTAETVRVPIDGTELVRLAVPGANFQASLANIFTSLESSSGGGSPGGSNTTVQFNNSGAFGGTNDFKWDSTGLTIGGATISGTTITPGTGEHVALGSHGVINHPIWAPGTGIDTNARTVLCPFIINHATEGDLGDRDVSDIVDFTAYKHTGEGGAAIVSLDLQPTVNPDSTGPFSHYYGINLVPDYLGQGPLQNFIAMQIIAEHGDGSGNVGRATQIQGVLCNAQPKAPFGNAIAGYFLTQASSPHADGFRLTGGRFEVEIGSGSGMMIEVFIAAGQFIISGLGSVTVPAVYTVLCEAPEGTGSQTVADCFGVYIEDHTGVGSDHSENLHSAGSTSDNVLEGYLSMVETTSPPSGVANRARLFTQDNGSGKTKLMVKFGSGAAQQIAIEP